MSARKSRHMLMQALIRGSVLYGTRPKLRDVDAELAELGRCVRLKPIHRQRLLQIFHASRALDTCLAEFLWSNGVTPQHGIGKMLNQLKAQQPPLKGFNNATASAFRSSIADKRNRYAHNAGNFPSSTREVDSLVSEVHSCMTQIL